MKYIKTLLKIIYNFLSNNMLTNIATIVLAIATFYSAQSALNIANNKEKYIINNGFKYSYDPVKNMNYKYYTVSIANSSADKPINLTSSFTIDISVDKEFSREPSSTKIATKHLNDLFPDQIFPVNLKYADELVLKLDENFASYIMSLLTHRIKVCDRKKASCYYKMIYIKFCLYDTLENKYCFVLSDDEIKEILEFENGKKYIKEDYYN